MSHRKAEHKLAILARLERALNDVYHNATPRYPTAQNDYEAELFQAWFEDAAREEIHYIETGGAYGTYLDQAPRLWGNGLAARQQRHAIRQRDEERSRCNPLDSRQHLTNALWETIGDYGTLYQWGRGGRTLAPGGLIKQHGGSGFSIANADEVREGKTWAEVVHLLRVIESFNRYVEGWCESIPAMWQDQKDANKYQADIDAHEGQKPYRVCRTVWR